MEDQVVSTLNPMNTEVNMGERTHLYLNHDNGVSTLTMHVATKGSPMIYKM